jgi:hypothetical protein
MGLCSGIKCHHYSNATKYPRKCFYETQCCKGYVDMGFQLIKFWFKNRRREAE